MGRQVRISFMNAESVIFIFISLKFNILYRLKGSISAKTAVFAFYIFLSAGKWGAVFVEK
jgi:hypothetical protein